MKLLTTLPMLFAMLLGPPSGQPGEPREPDELVVIVHADRTAPVDLEEVAQIFLKKRRFWPDGTPILPVNRNAGADTRAHFDSEVFGTSISQLGVYWNRAYFNGVLPPATLASDEAVRRFVADEPRAIGYVRRESVDDSVRVVMRIWIGPHVQLDSR